MTDAKSPDASLRPGLPLLRFRVWHLWLLALFVAVAIVNIRDQGRRRAGPDRPGDRRIRPLRAAGLGGMALRSPIPSPAGDDGGPGPLPRRHGGAFPGGDGRLSADRARLPRRRVQPGSTPGRRAVPRMVVNRPAGASRSSLWATLRSRSPSVLQSLFHINFRLFFCIGSLPTGLGGTEAGRPVESRDSGFLSSSGILDTRALHRAWNQRRPITSSTWGPASNRRPST